MRGVELGPYRIERELGRGAMGTVYLARVVSPVADLARGTPVALKVLHAHVVSRPRAVLRLEREAVLGGRVRHENVVSFFGAGSAESDDGPVRWLAMEYAEGRTLREMQQDLGRVPEALLREIAVQIAAGLAAIHAAGGIHRDLKPENVLVTADQHVRIMDLGMVRLQDESLAVTGDGAFSGSLRYAAPELFRGQRAGPRADLYALGIMLHELASGTHPVPGTTPVDVITAHLSRSPPPLRRDDPSISPFFCALVSWLLAKDPTDRPGSAALLRDTLRAAEHSAWWKERSLQGADEECGFPEVPVSRRGSLHGRERQIAGLRAAWVRALAGQGGTTLLVGEAGIGKSSLVAGLLREIEGTDVHVLYGAYVADGAPGGLASGLRRIARAAGGPVAGLRRVLGEQADLAAPLAAALGFRDAAVAPALLSTRALHGVLARVVAGLAEERPVLWIVEDVHDARPTSLDLLASLARAACGRRVLLLVTARPGPAESRLSALETPTCPERMEVPRLGPTAIADLLAELCGSRDQARSVAPAIAERSDGVPLFVIAMWRQLRDRGWPVAPEHDGLAAIRELPLPAAVRDPLRARLDALDAEERRLLSVGAVQGATFDPDPVAHVLGESRLSVLRRLAEIERRTGLVRPAGRVVRFDHREVREVLHDELAAADRRRLHTALARVLASGGGAEDAGGGDGARTAVSGETAYVVVQHHLAGQVPSEALPFVDAAMDHLRRAFRHDVAIDVLRALLARPALVGPGRACALQLELADHLERLARTVEQRAALDEALRLAESCGDQDLTARALVRVGALLVATGRPRDAVALLADALGTIPQGDHAHVARASVDLGAALHELGRLGEARQRLQSALDASLAGGDEALEAAAAGALGNVMAELGVPRSAEILQRRALAIAQRRGDLEVESRVAGDLGVTLAGLGRRAEALRLFERQRELALATGDGRAAGRCALNLANVHRASGRLDDARASFARAIDLYRDAGDRQGLGIALAALGQMNVMLGDVAGARQGLSRALAVFGELGAERDQGHVLVSLGKLERRHGDAEAARAFFERSLACHEATACVQGSAAACLGLGTLAMDGGGDVAAARELLARARELSLERRLFDVAVLAALHEVHGAHGAQGAHDDRGRMHALELLAKHGDALDAASCVEAHHLAWKIGGGERHLRAAAAALDDLLDAAAPENRGVLLAQGLHGEIRSAAADLDRRPSSRARSPA